MPDKNKIQQKEEDSKKKKKEEILPPADPDTLGQTPGSMSEGNLSNNRYGRERTRTPHTKTSVMGSDEDGQAF